MWGAKGQEEKGNQKWWGVGEEEEGHLEVMKGFMHVEGVQRIFRVFLDLGGVFFGGMEYIGHL